MMLLLFQKVVSVSLDIYVIKFFIKKKKIILREEKVHGIKHPCIDTIVSL